jgi:hypothetical protein
MKTLRQALVVGLIVAVTGSLAAAQTFTGGLRGAVKDANGVIPGVTVELVNEENGATREAVSNEAGEYNFAAVPGGTYTVKATLTGFKTYESKGVRVATQQFVTLDITLEVGQLQETITVTGAAPLIDTSTASTGAVIAAEELSALPSGGRSAFLFAVTVPTVVASGDAQFNRQQDQTNASLLSLGGGTRRGNNYLIDGVPITDMRNRASANPTIEALQDVAIQVHNYDAETGRTGGGTFNVAAKSGTNDWHGSGFYQNRPKWGMAQNFYARPAPLPDTYFNLGGGGFGGPIIRNRTFFWAAAEGYGSNTTRNGNLRLPTDREKAGDFSQTFAPNGQLEVIYDPLTGDASGAGRQPFPGNIIPADRINPVARAITSYLPTVDNQVSNGSPNRNRVAEIEDRAMMYTAKVDHRFNDAMSLTGFYLYNKSDEPCANYWEPGLSGENRFADPGDYILKRRINVLALNNTWLPSNNTVVTLRYGLTRFQDDNTLSIDFDPSTLGFSQSFLGNIQNPKFPQVRVTDYDSTDFGRMAGAIDPTELMWKSWALNGSVSKLVGRHTFKAGADFRAIGLDFQDYTDTAADFRFDRYFTSSNGTNNNAGNGNGFASMLLGYPSGRPGQESTMGQSGPLSIATRYFGGYIQDDFRVNPKLTMNYGLRLEHEAGLSEENDSLTVAFDETLNPGGALGNVIVNGQPVRGGLVYAGQNGANDYQGDPPAVKFSPRVGMVYSFNPKTVLRAGYGIYWAPWNYPAPTTTNYGQIGYNNLTLTQQAEFRPNVTLTNPYPNGVAQPVGNALGALTGVGTQIEYVDQNKKAPYVQQYSFDINRELPGNLAVGFEYAGATGRDLGYGGSVDARININQVPTEFLSLGSALTQQVPNPFFGLPAGQGFAVTSPTITRAQTLRPFPQFGNIYQRQTTGASNQYHAAIFKFEKRVNNGWGGRINYTYSRLNDDQFAEGNFFSRSDGDAQDAFNLDAEYDRSILDVPHKIVMSPIVELPFGEGKKWMTTGIGNILLGNWTLSSIISFESGFPMSPYANTNGLAAIFADNQYVNPGTGDTETSGSYEDRLLGTWLTPAGTSYTDAGALALGTLGRIDEDTRTPMRNNWDFVATKAVRFVGSVRGEIRFEVLNITDTPKVRGPISALGAGNYGQIRVQSGFMRLTQLMFRLSF